jgi:hypothetical protein
MATQHTCLLRILQQPCIGLLDACKAFHTVLRNLPALIVQPDIVHNCLHATDHVQSVNAIGQIQRSHKACDVTSSIMHDLLSASTFWSRPFKFINTEFTWCSSLSGTQCRSDSACQQHRGVVGSNETVWPASGAHFDRRNVVRRVDEVEAWLLNVDVALTSGNRIHGLPLRCP